MPHRIRLRGPWEYDSLTHCFTRQFHQPTGLTAATRVWLVVEKAAAHARIALNGKTLGEAQAGQGTRLNITAELQPHNLLSITFTAAPPESASRPDRALGQVSLEIEEPSA